MASYRVQFETKSLDVIQTVAELFVYTRSQTGLTVDEIARHLQISPFYLEALEEGNYGKLPSYVYTRNFVRCYGQYLGLRTEPLLALFEQEWTLFEKHQQQLFPVNRSRLGISRSDFWTLPRWLRWAGASLLVVAIFGYLGFELYDLRQPPLLSIYTPQEELITDKQVVEISGKTEPEVTLSINNQTVLSDVEGNFTERVTLQPGLNVIEIGARKKYSRESSVYRKVIVQEKQTFTNAQEPDHRS